MNTDSTPSHDAELTALHGRLASLREAAAAWATGNERKRRTTLTVSLALVVLCLLALSSLTTLVFRLDAEAVTQVGRLKVEKHLPQGRETLASYLRSQAPRFVRQTMVSLLDLLPHLRRAVAEHVMERLQAVCDRGEKELVEAMEGSIEETRTRLEAQYPEKTEGERLKLLVDQVAADFRVRLEDLLDALYPEYAEELQRVHAFVDDLATRDEEKLLPRERTQRDLIRTLLRLMAREQAGA